MGVGGIADIATSRQVKPTQSDPGQHMQYRLDFVREPCQMITAASDEEAKRKVLASLNLHTDATKEHFAAKGGRRILHVSEDRQIFPPVHH